MSIFNLDGKYESIKYTVRSYIVLTPDFFTKNPDINKYEYVTRVFNEPQGRLDYSSGKIIVNTNQQELYDKIGISYSHQASHYDRSPYFKFTITDGGLDIWKNDYESIPLKIEVIIHKRPIGIYSLLDNYSKDFELNNEDFISCAVARELLNKNIALTNVLIDKDNWVDGDTDFPNYNYSYTIDVSGYFDTVFDRYSDTFIPHVYFEMEEAESGAFGSMCKLIESPVANPETPFTGLKIYASKLPDYNFNVSIEINKAINCSRKI